MVSRADDVDAKTNNEIKVGGNGPVVEVLTPICTSWLYDSCTTDIRSKMVTKHFFQNDFLDIVSCTQWFNHNSPMLEQNQ